MPDTPPKATPAPHRLVELYQRLYRAFGPQHWWPGNSPFEVMVGAVLTQNTAWSNVEKAIANLEEAGVLEIKAMRALPSPRLAELIRPAGYFNLKERRLRNLLDAVANQLDGHIQNLGALPLERARALLLGVNGVGPETADAIMLYAARMPTFVVDIYTRRILLRHGMITEQTGYERIRRYFMEALENDHQLFNEYHALLVRLAQRYCKKSQYLCQGCPAEGI